MTTRTYQTVTFTTASEYRQVMSSGLRDLNIVQKINIRNNLAVVGSPDHSQLILIGKTSAHYK